MNEGSDQSTNCNCDSNSDLHTLNCPARHKSQDDVAFHIRLVSRRVNERLGGDATIDDLVAIMLDIGWQPPSQSRCAELYTGEAFKR